MQISIPASYLFGMRWLWVIWSGYGLYILYTVYSYFHGKVHAVNVDIYNRFYIKKLALVVLILAISVVLRLLNKTMAAKLIAGIPAAIMALVLLAGIAAWVFTWFVMWWGGK